MNKFILLVGTIASFFASQAHAGVTLSVGSGSAVSHVDASANFESTDALTDPAYVEDGISVTRQNLSYNNNNCGFAGCTWAFPYFSGNYMYGTYYNGGEGYFDISTTGGNVFNALEFIFGSGYGTDPANLAWSAYLGGLMVGSGSTQLTKGSVAGFSGGLFDTLRFTNEFNTGLYGPAFDSVRAQYGVLDTAVPEPSAWALMILGFGALGGLLRQRKQARVTAYN